jgi:eukaryotic-like serine/threonine-protein kinase
MANEFLTRNDEIVDGMYRLGALVKRSIRSTVYKTEFGEDELQAVIKIREYESSGSEELLEQWRNAMELAHPNLLKIYATGSSVLNGVPIVYVVMERADESLNSVLAERALTADETRELLVPAVAALHYLHKKGYAHSGLGASNVLAVQNQLKLSSDNAIRVSDGGSTTEDMKALGVLIVRALTQQIPNGDGQSDLDILRKAPDPFPDIVRHCLDPDSTRRWTAEQVEATLKGPVGEPVLPMRKPSVEKTPAVVDVHGVYPTARPEQGDPDEAHSKTGIPKWIYAGLAALILIVVLSAVMRKRDASPVVAVVPPAAVPERIPGAETADRAASAEVLSPAPKPDPRTAATSARGRKADGWSVIVATYASRELAEKRMRDLMRRWPKFNIGVFQPRTEKTQYLVVLGQNLSEDQAEELRKRAVDSGLPRDTYIKRVM